MFRSLIFLLVWVLGPASAADVYVWFDAGGEAHFASQPLHNSYQLLFKDVSAERTKVAVDATAIAPVEVAADHHSCCISAPKAVRLALEKAASKHGVTYELLLAMAYAESGFNERAISPKGAIGLLQLMPATARRYGVAGEHNDAIRENLLSLQINADAGSRYLSDLLKRFGGNTSLALAAYNAGEGAVTRAGNRVPDYKETRDYVRKVMSMLADNGSAADLDRPASDRGSVATASAGVLSAGTSVTVFRGTEMDIQTFESGFGQ